MTEHDDRDDLASALLGGHLDPQEPRVRARHIAAALDAFEELSAGSTTAPDAGVVVRTNRWRRPLLAIASVAAAAIVVAGITLREHNPAVRSSDVASVARRPDATVLRPQAGVTAGAAQDSAANKSAAAPSVGSRSAASGADTGMSLGVFADEAALRAAVVALDRAPVTTSTPPAAPVPASAPTSTTIAAFDAALPCATTPVTGAVELHRYRAVLRFVPVTIVVVRVDGGATPVIGVLEPPDCHLREL